MKFEMSTAADYYGDSKEIKALEEIGFTFYPIDEALPRLRNVKIKSPITIEINSLEELVDISEKVGSLIVDKGFIMVYNHEIE